MVEWITGSPKVEGLYWAIACSQVNTFNAPNWKTPRPFVIKFKTYPESGLLFGSVWDVTKKRETGLVNSWCAHDIAYHMPYTEGDAPPELPKGIKL